MNRRTVLRIAAVVPAAALAGCTERLQSVGLTVPVLVYIENETDVDRNVAVTAYAIDDDRQTYDEAFNAPSDHAASVGHLSNFDQQVRVELFESSRTTEGDDDVGGEGDEYDQADVIADEETLIGESTQSLTIYITDEGLDLELEYR